MTLFDCAVGESARVTKIGLEANVKRRLEILGMTENSAVEVLGRKRRGAMIIRVRGTRFAVGRRFAEGIFAEVTENEE